MLQFTTFLLLKHEISKYVGRNGGIFQELGRSIPQSAVMATVKTI